MSSLCGLLIAKVHVQQETRLKGFIDTPDTIYDNGKVTIAAAHKCSSSHARSKEIIDFIKKTRLGANRSRDYVDIDSDLRSQLSKGKTLVSYSSTNDKLDEG